MKTLTELRLQRYVFYKDVTLTLDYPGVTVVYGVNLAAGKQGHSNGSGKSLLFSAIPNIVFGTDAVSSHLKSRAKRDSFSSGSSITLQMTDGKNDYSIVKAMEGTSFKYELYRNGVEAKTRTVSYATEKIAQLLPFSPEEFYSLIYLDSRRPSTLQFGTPVERMAFFTNLFHLHNYDEVRKIFAGKLKELRDDKLILNELQTELSGLQADIGDIDVAQLEMELELANKDASRNLRKQRQLMSDISNLDAGIQHGADIQRLLEALSIIPKFPDNPTESSLSAATRWLNRKIQTTRELIRRVSSWNIYNEAMLEYQIQRRKILKEIRDDYRDLDSPSIKRAYEKLETKRIQLQSELNAKRKKMATLGSTLVDVDEPRYSVDHIETKLDEIQKAQSRCDAKISELRETLDLLESHKDHSSTECPLCMTTLNAGHIATLISSIKPTLSEQESKSARIKASRVKYTKLLQDAKLYVTQQGILSSIEVLKEGIFDIERKLGSVDSDQIEVLKSNYTLKLRLENLKRPTKPDTDDVDFDIDTLNQDIATYSDLATKCTIYTPLIESVLAIDQSIDPKKRQDELRGQLKNLTLEYETKFSELPKLQSKVDIAKANNQRLLELTARISDIESGLEDYPIYEALIEAFSNKGLKLLVIQSIARIIESNMNKYAPLLFSEPFRFEFKVEANNFHILAHRNYGKRQVPSDVRNLSGAESRFFSFLLPLSILPLIPSDRRCNLLVMDEPTANLDENAVEMFINFFIPKLRTIIPSIVIITPQDRERFSDAREITVTKRGGQSFITCNQPN